MNKIYIVTEEWMNEGEGGCTPHPFSTWEKAKEFFDWCVQKEFNEYMAADPHADDNIDETEDLNDETKDYALEKIINDNGPCTWAFYEKGNYNDYHVSYSLCEFEVDCDWTKFDK